MDELVNGLNLRPLPELIDEAEDVTVQLQLPRFHLVSTLFPLRLPPGCTGLMHSLTTSS